MTALEFFRRLALGVAIGSLSVFFGAAIYSWLFQRWESARFDASISSPTAPPPAKTAPREPGKIAPLAPSGPIGRLSIPRLHLTAMVEDADDDDTLRKAVGHVRGTPLPGAPGNAALAGHRDTFFSDLKDLRRGDEIVYETRSMIYRYRVDEMMIVDPQNTSVLARSPDKRLTLITCFPFHYVGSAPRRFIAQAREVAEAARPVAVDRSAAKRAGNFRRE